MDDDGVVDGRRVGAADSSAADAHGANSHGGDVGSMNSRGADSHDIDAGDTRSGHGASGHSGHRASDSIDTVKSATPVMPATSAVPASSVASVTSATSATSADSAQPRLPLKRPGHAMKPPFSLAQQRRQLAAHNISFDGFSSHEVEQILSRINYYRITGYAVQYRIRPESAWCEDGTQFGDIMSIYHFDEELRFLLLRYVEGVEVKLRAVISHVFTTAHCMQSPHDQHTKAEYYYRKRDALAIIEAYTSEDQQDQSTPWSHKRHSHRELSPLWVMVETMPFSRLVRYYQCLKRRDRQAVAKEFGSTADNLQNALLCIVRLRNKSAHANRIYNTMNLRKARLVSTEVKRLVDAQSVFAYLMLLCSCQPTLHQRKQFARDFKELLLSFDPHVVRPDLLGIPESGLRLLQ
jgi:abortive infection bacteriophage resistance protein